MYFILYLIICCIVIYILEKRNKKKSINIKNIHTAKNNQSQVLTQNNKFVEITIPPREDPQPQFLSACYKLCEQNEYEAYFYNGELFNVKPRDKQLPLYENRGVAYCARYIISDSIKYDLEDPKSIISMKIPSFNEIKGMPNITIDLSYIMKMKANNEDRPELTVPLVYKASNMMIASPIEWGKKRLLSNNQTFMDDRRNKIW